MKFVITLVFVTACTVVGYSQCRDLASYQFSTLESIFKQYDYNVRDTFTYGQLNKGQQDIFIRKFYSGNSYALGVIGDSNANDIDLYVYDSNLNLIAKDSSTDKSSIVTFTPRYTGDFYIKVKMYDSDRNSCWTMVYGYQ